MVSTDYTLLSRYEKAEADQKRPIENKRRARECAARNKQKYGTARKPKARRDACVVTPRTYSAPMHASAPSISEI